MARQDRRAWSAYVRGVINSIDDIGSTHPRCLPTKQEQQMVLHESWQAKTLSRKDRL